MRRNSQEMLFDRHPANAEELKKALEKVIKTEFYNTVATYVHEAGYSRENLREKLALGIKKYITNLLLRSMRSSGISLLMGKEVTLVNCPDRYRELFAHLIALKPKPPDAAAAERAIAAMDFTPIITGIMSLESFTEINPSHHLLEMIGCVTTDQIRESFYNLMFMQAELAVTDGWITKEDIEDQGIEVDIYTLLPAYTLLDTLLRSRHLPGIQLIDRNLVTMENCPLGEEFPQLVEGLLAIKAALETISDQQIADIKNRLSWKRNPPYVLQPAESKACEVITGKIIGVSILISQRKMFLNMGQNVLNAYLGIDKPVVVAAAAQAKKF